MKYDVFKCLFGPISTKSLDSSRETVLPALSAPSAPGSSLQLLHGSLETRSGSAADRLMVCFVSVGRRQFLDFDSAHTAGSVLGCGGEELHTAVFKHHLRQLLQRATGGSRERPESEEGESVRPRG